MISEYGLRARHGDGGIVERLGDIIRRRAALTPDAPALIGTGIDVSFAELDEASNRVADALLASGAQVGDRVVHLGANSPEFLQVAYGAMKAGLVFTPLNTRLSPGEIGEIVAGPDEFAAWRAGGRDLDPQQDGRPDDTVLIMFSSGTTGRPKGVMLSSTNLACGLYLMNQLVEMDERSVTSAPVPFFHVSGLGLALVSTLNGARLLLERPGGAEELLAYLVEDRVSHANLVPTVIERLLDLPAVADADLSALAYVLYGAAPMPVPLLERATRVFGCRFLQSYGLTESTGGFTLLSPEDHLAGTARPELLRSVGRVLEGTRVRVVDPKTLLDVPSGAHGEVLVAGPRVMNGYWRRPAETRAAVVEGGWLRTGDGGSFDADGFLYLHERLKDMIVSGGENIYPAEIERILAAHPDIAECAVVAVASTRWGESPWAYVVPRAGSSLTGPDVIAWVRGRLAHYKCPVGVTLAGDLPRTATGKVQRARLREDLARAE